MKINFPSSVSARHSEYLLFTSSTSHKNLATVLKPYQGLDFVVDGGLRVDDPSTVVDMTVNPPKIIRQGKVNWVHASNGSVLVPSGRLDYF